MERRDPDRVPHAMLEMVMARASAIACGYEDAIDLDRLRHDPLNLYESIYCQRGQMENLIKLHKAQLASDRMSCQRDRQSGAARPPHRRVLADGMARRDPKASARHVRVRYDKSADQIRRASSMSRIPCPAADQLPGGVVAASSLGLMPSGP